MVTLEKGTTAASSEKWKEIYSLSGVRLLESAVAHAKELKQSSLRLTDIVLVLPQEETIQEIPHKLNLKPEAIRKFLESKLANSHSWPAPGVTHDRSIGDIIKVAKKESEDQGASKIRAGDIMMAILESSTTSGQALKEALSSGKEKGVSFLNQLRHVINQVEEPWTA